MTSSCPVLDDADLWYKNSEGEWQKQKWVATKTKRGYRLTLTPKET
jgi:hypothetical protein